VVHVWNKFKGGVDTNTQISRSLRFQHPVDSHQQSFLTCIEKACVNFYFLYSYLFLRGDILSGKIRSEEEYRQAKLQCGLTFDACVKGLVLKYLGNLVATEASRLLTQRQHGVETQTEDKPQTEPQMVVSAEPTTTLLVSEEEYSDFCAKLQKSFAGAFKSANTRGSLAWRVRHYTDTSPNPLLYHHMTRYVQEKRTREAREGVPAKDGSSSVRERACSYCHFSGNRPKNDKGEPQLGSYTRWSCSGCRVFLCSESYGTDKTGAPLPSCFALWHMAGEMVRPDDDATPTSSGPLHRKAVNKKDLYL